MYYDNKSTFYVRQYGPTILVGIFSIILIGSGLFIYLKSTSTNPLKIETAKNINNQNTVKEASNIETEALKNDKIAESNEVNYFDSLKTLEKSKELYVKSISEAGDITLQLDKKDIVVTLIGINLDNVNIQVIDKLKGDLLDKKVRIVFDTQKIENSKTYVYLYKEDNLYNETFLKTGLVTIRQERQNVSLMGKLTKAQLYARENSLGVWKQ